MKSLTVYEHKTAHAFRIVVDLHEHSEQTKEHFASYRVAVYQGSTVADAAHAALAVETRIDICSQIARFLAPEGAQLTNKEYFAASIALGHVDAANPRSASVDRSPAEGETAPVADNSGGTFYRVTRFCCTSGMCMDCGAMGNVANRKRILHADKLRKSTAESMMAGWARYEPVMSAEA